MSLGHTLSLGNMPAHKITEWHKELGPILRVKIGVQDWIFIGDSTMAHDIFTLEANLTSYRPYFMFGNAISNESERYA
jgi:hypothetical protein